MKISRQWRWWAALWLAAVLLDAGTTYLGMSSGASVEGNPAAAWLMNELGLTAAIALLSTYSLLFAGGSMLQARGLYAGTAIWVCRAVGAAKLTVGAANVSLLAAGVDVWARLPNFPAPG